MSLKSWATTRATNAGANLVLFGDQSVEATSDGDPARQADAFPFSNSAAGTTASVSVYVDASNAAQTLIAGIYSDKKGHPSSLLTRGSLSSPTAGAWNQVPVGSVSVSSGRTYWVAVLGEGGQLSFRDHAAGSCRSETSAQTTLTSLPSSWRTGRQQSGCPISAYVNGYTVSGGMAPPSDMTLPAVSGTATEGQALSSSTGTWNGNPTSYGYQWRDCDGSGNNCSNIAGATSAKYTLGAGDVGATVRAVVTATNAGGSTAATSNQTAAVAAPTAAPSNTTLPAISGTATQGQPLSASNGSWSGSPTSYSYQWRDCDSSGNNCTNISGATSSSYTPAASDVGSTIRVVVTATNAGGSTSATSNQTTTIGAAPPTAAFAYSANPVTGQAVHFDASASKCFATPCTYTWADDPPSGGTWPLGSGQAVDFTFQIAATKYVTLTVTDAANQTATVEHDVVVGAGTTTTTPTTTTTTTTPTTTTPSTSAPPSSTTLPAISGTATQGQPLATSNGGWSGSPTSYSYQWRDCDSSGNNCTNISGATSSSYTPAASDVGSTIRVVVTATNAGGSASATANQTAVVTSGSGSGSTGQLVCTQHVTTATFASAFSAAGAGAVLCLAPGNYGTFNGGSKTAPGVTITSDASAGGTQANVIFNTANLGGAKNITLDSVTLGQSGNGAVSIQSNPTAIAVTNSLFKGDVEIDNIQSSNHANVLFNHDDFAHTGLDCSNLQNNAVIGLHYSGAGHSGVTVENSTIANTDCDGIHTGTGIDVLNNTFTNICEDNGSDPQHTDNMQFEGAVGGRIAGNYFHEEITNCITQGLTSYDGGTNGVLLEDNVVDIGRPFGIEWYGDINSTIRHNTVAYRATGCEYNQACGQIIIDCKPSEFNCGVNAAYGTQVYDNLANVGLGDGAKTARNDHNFSAKGVTYAGGPNPPPDGGLPAFNNYLLAPGSADKGAASDGTDPGIAPGPIP